MPDAGPAPWWRSAVVYEVYPRSFADGDSDGVGDVPGLRARLGHLADLGVDALWIAPWYPSPMADGGYDVTDHCDLDPRFGTLADADALIADAHALGLRVVVDIVPNHTSHEHAWFAEALAAGPGSPARDRYHFADGHGDSPPNDWVSAFGGPAWTRVVEADGRPGQWYLHQFAPEQPDLNWDDPVVVEAFDQVLRFWLDRGVDGLRLDAVPAMGKLPGLPDAGHGPDALFDPAGWTASPHWDTDGVHDVLRHWRKIADSYDGDRMLVVEAVVSSPERLARYVREDEAHTAFNFGYLRCPWDAHALRAGVDATLAALAPTGAPATWVLSSHDEVRHLTRFGRAESGAAPMAADPGGHADTELGTRRARAAALLTLALPGGAYLYQGEELGLDEVDDLPDDVLQDPAWERSGHTVRGRDGCRVPLPWSGDAPPFGFTDSRVRPWLPLPARWADRTVARQRDDPSSMLALYRAALSLRRQLAGGEHRESLTWVDAPDGVLVFDRGPRWRCVANLSGAPVDLTGHGEPVLVSGPVGDAGLPPDTAAWLRR